MTVSLDRIAEIRARWPEHEASWQDMEDLCEEVIRMRRHAQAWALYAFIHHGDDARLYNGLADLGGVTPDGDGWMPLLGAESAGEHGA